MTIEALTWQKDWMVTYSGGSVYPLDLHPEEVKLKDIAHSLATQARYNGHCRFPYWVGQHCILISEALERDGYDVPTQRIGLLHDAGETYTGDMTRPMKNSLKKRIVEAGLDPKLYKTIEHEVGAVVAKRFGLPFPWPEVVEEYDTRITQDEKQQLFNGTTKPWTIPLPPLNVRITEMSWFQCKNAYLRRAAKLGIV